jgi:hypothetical protein
MDTGYLDRLADQLKVNKTAACCRAINRMLAEMKKRCNAGEYGNEAEAENAFRTLVENQYSCQGQPGVKKASSL